MRTQAVHSAVALLGLSLAPALASAAALRLLPTFAEDGYDYAASMADNGTVAGNAQDFWGSMPVVWSKGSDAYAPPVSPALPAGAAGGELRWISADASLLAGYAALSLTDAGDNNHVPVLWSRFGQTGAYSASVLPRLGSAASETFIASGSANGFRLVGQSGPAPSAAIWRGSPGGAYSVQALALPADATGASLATSISGDGARAAGYHETSAGTQAVTWTEDDGVYSVAKLQLLPGGARGFAETISRDGTLAAGASDDATRLRPVVWDTATGAVTALETLPGFEATAFAIAENKAWLGGRATDTGSYESGAVLWNRDGKVFDLVDLASAAGVTFDGLAPESVTGIHFISNGLYTIVGTGLNELGLTQAFVLENLPLATPASEPDDEGSGGDDPAGQDPSPENPGGTGDTEAPSPALSTGVFLDRHSRPEDSGPAYGFPPRTNEGERPLGASSRKRSR